VLAISQWTTLGIQLLLRSDHCRLSTFRFHPTCNSIGLQERSNHDEPCQTATTQLPQLSYAVQFCAERSSELNINRLTCLPPARSVRCGGLMRVARHVDHGVASPTAPHSLYGVRARDLWPMWWDQRQRTTAVSRAPRELLLL
jgi:hypothetical protein